MKNLLILLLLICIKSHAFSSEILEGTVTDVIDGNTIILDLKHNKLLAKLYGIIAPELDQPYGKKAKEQLRRLINDRNVKIYVTGTNYIGIDIIKIFYAGEYINSIMLKEGAAWQNQIYESDIELTIATDWAQEEKQGLWKNENPVAPWNYQDNNKAEKQNEIYDNPSKTDPKNKIIPIKKIPQKEYERSLNKSELNVCSKSINILRNRYGKYIDKILKRINQAIIIQQQINPINLNEGNVIMSFTINSTGLMDDIKFFGSSPANILNEISAAKNVLQDVRNSGAFDPPTQEMLNDPDFKNILINFVFEKK